MLRKYLVCMKLMISVFKIRSSSFSFVYNEQTRSRSIDRLYWQISSLVCPLRNHVTWLLSHQSLSACKDGGYRKYGIKLRRTGYEPVYYCDFRHKTHSQKEHIKLFTKSSNFVLIRPKLSKTL